MRIRITRTQLRRVIRESCRRMGSRNSSIRLLEDNHTYWDRYHAKWLETAQMSEEDFQALADEYRAMAAAGEKAAKGYKERDPDNVPQGPWTGNREYWKNPDMKGYKFTARHRNVVPPMNLDIRPEYPILFGMSLEDAYNIHAASPAGLYPYGSGKPAGTGYADYVEYYTRKDVKARIAQAKKKFASTPKAKRDFEDERYRWAIWQVGDEGPPEAVIDDLALDLLRNVRKYAKGGVGRLAGRYRKKILKLGMSKEDFDTAFGDAMTDGDPEVSDRFYRYKGDDLPQLINDLVSKIYR